MFEKIAAVLAEYKGIDVSEITMESSFADLGVDSLDAVELVMNLEDELGVTIEMNSQVQTIAELVRLVEESK